MSSSHAGCPSGPSWAVWGGRGGLRRLAVVRLAPGLALDDLGQRGGRVLIFALVWDQQGGGGDGDRAARLLEVLAGWRLGAADLYHFATQGGTTHG